CCRGFVCFLTRLFGYRKTLRMVCGPNYKGSSPWRFTSGTNNGVQAVSQPEDCEGAWHHHSTIGDRPRRRGERVGLFAASAQDREWHTSSLPTSEVDTSVDGGGDQRLSLAVHQLGR